MSDIERSLIVLKPDTVSRAIVGEILSRFEKKGLKIVGIKMLNPDEKFFYHHYETIGKMVSRRGEKVFLRTLKFMQATPVLAVVLEWASAIKIIRQTVGTTFPSDAIPGTIRGDYAHISFDHADAIEKAIANLIHASGNKEEAEQEIAHRFKPEELFDYERADQQFMY